MNTLLAMISPTSALYMIAVFVAFFAFISWIASRPRGRQLRALANISEGRWPFGKKGYYTDAAVATRHLLVKSGSDARHVAVCGAADKPCGFQTDTSDGAEEIVNVQGFGRGDETVLGVSSGVIPVDGDCYTAAGGKVQAEPTVPGTYYLVGRNIGGATVDGGDVQMDPCEPIKVVVVAALTSVNGAIAAANGSAAALATEVEKLGDDVRAIAAALATPALVKVLAA